MDPTIEAEVALEVLRDAIHRWHAEPATIRDAQGGEEHPNTRKEACLATLVEEASSLTSVQRVLGTAVDRYGALVDVKKWLGKLGSRKLDDPSLLAEVPILFRKVSEALDVRDVPAEIGQAIERYRRHGKEEGDEEGRESSTRPS